MRTRTTTTFMTHVIAAIVCDFLSVSTRAQLSQCDITNDSCAYKADGECDVPLYCSSGDCYDCDPCQKFNWDCSSCISNGCYYCASDQICSSFNSNHNIFLEINGRGARSLCPASRWVKECPSTSTHVFSDPMYSAMQWAYQLVNVEPVWKAGITGSGVTIRFNDDGVDVSHPEFVGKFDLSSSCSIYLPHNNEQLHGTASASIATAKANNGNCAAGMAPNARLSVCNNLGDQGKTATEVEAFQTELNGVDISSNSWGSDGCYFDAAQDGERRLQQCPFDPNHQSSPCSVCDFSNPKLTKQCENAITRYCQYFFESDQVACTDYFDLFVECGFNAIPNAVQKVLNRGITNGRGGKGIIYVFAAGNEFDVGDDVNFEGYLNSRLTISVGAVGKDGLHASYSSIGAPVFVSAPGGDVESRSNNIVAMPGGGCHDVDYGTSFSCPTVSGIIALLLEVNPNLGWRDVQGIIAETSRMTDNSDSSWTINAAGLHHSYKYGFGIIDAKTAVTSAQQWLNYGQEQTIVERSGNIKLPIQDDGVSTLSAVKIKQNVIVESVVVYLDVSHGARGYLDIRLISPSGTESILSPGHAPENSKSPKGQHWKLMTVRSWGESSKGDWLLSISENPINVMESTSGMDILRSWRLVVYGHTANSQTASVHIANGLSGIGSNGDGNNGVDSNEDGRNGGGRNVRRRNMMGRNGRRNMMGGNMMGRNGRGRNGRGRNGRGRNRRGRNRRGRNGRRNRRRRRRRRNRDGRNRRGHKLKEQKSGICPDSSKYCQFRMENGYFSCREVKRQNSMNGVMSHHTEQATVCVRESHFQDGEICSCCNGSCPSPCTCPCDIYNKKGELVSMDGVKVIIGKKNQRNLEQCVAPGVSINILAQNPMAYCADC